MSLFRPALSLRPVAPTAEPPSEEDVRLLEELRDGSLEGAAQAYDRWHQRVRVLARRLLGDDGSAEDVVQDVFVMLPRATRRFRGEPAVFESFVLGIAVKRTGHYRRAAQRRRLAMARLASEQVNAFGTPEQSAYQRELGERLQRALDRLPHVQRLAFVLCDIEGMTSTEAAQVMDAPQATVRTRLFHAHKRLRALLEKDVSP